MRKLKIYLDTSVINFAISEREFEKTEKEETNKLLLKIKKGEIIGIISSLVLEEISAASEPKRSVLKSVIKGINLDVVELDDEIEELADKYIKNGIIPAAHKEDALHIAAAVISNAEVIVSWNFEHMVKLKTKRGVKGINEMFGYGMIEILTPQEVD